MTTKLCSAPPLQPPPRLIEAAAVFSSTKLWERGSVLTVSFLNPNYSESSFIWEDAPDGTLSVTEQDFENKVKDTFINNSPAAAVKKVIEDRIAPIVPTLTFSFVSGAANIVVRFDVGGGSSSFIGTDCLRAEQFSTTFAWLNVGTIIHEFSHALGMYHEHQNPTSTIKWNRDKLYAYFQQNDGWTKQDVDNQILNPITSDKIDYSKFDPESVMLYFFSADLTRDGRGTAQNMRYSATDIQWLGNKYGVDSETIAKNIEKYGKGSVEESGGSSGVPAETKKESSWIILALIASIILFLVLKWL